MLLNPFSGVACEFYVLVGDRHGPFAGHETLRAGRCRCRTDEIDFAFGTFPCRYLHGGDDGVHIIGLQDCLQARRVFEIDCIRCNLWFAFQSLLPVR